MRQRIIFWTVLAVLGLLGTVAAEQIARRMLSSGIAPAPMPAEYPPLTNPPPALPAQSVEKSNVYAAVHAGTPGRELLPPPLKAQARVVVLGGLEPGGAAWNRAELVRELNLLGPDLVLCTGDTIGGFAGSADGYAGQANAVVGTFNALTPPWYPCVGRREVGSATGDPRDRRFAELYEKYFGPRYYSIDCGEMHVLMLDSEESPTGQLTPAQLTWIAEDLRTTFDRRRARRVLVAMHRPLWRDAKSDWARVHEMFVAFNRRPVVSIEGSASTLQTPRVQLVLAQSPEGCARDTTRDAIAHYVVGPTAGRGERNVNAGRMAQYALLRIPVGLRDGPEVSFIEPGHVFPGDQVTAPDRELLAALEGIDEKTLGLEGSLPQPVGKATGTGDLAASPLRLVLGNPLSVPLDVQVGLVGAVNGRGKARGSFESPWQMTIPYGNYQLKPGERLKYRLALQCPVTAGEVVPPEVEFRLAVRDSKGRLLETRLARRLALVPRASIGESEKVGEQTWLAAARHGLYRFEPRKNDLDVWPPAFELVADATTLYLRVHVSGVARRYVPQFAPPWDLPGDAVSVAWATSGKADEVQRIVALPFAPEGQQLLANSGVGRKQTALALLDRQACPATLKVTPTDDGYGLELALPRAVVGRGKVLLNVGAFMSHQAGGSEFRSWAREDAGPDGWGTVQVVRPATTATSRPGPG